MSPKKKKKKKQFLMEYMCNDVRKIDFHFYVFKKKYPFAAE